MIELVCYQPNHDKLWNQIVENAVNGHFMFYRQYMNYHNDRHQDASFIVFYKQKAIAVLPASKVKGAWVSHGGLTFGGLVIKSKFNKIEMIKGVYQALFEQLIELNFTAALIKPVPWIYHTSPCEGEAYAITQLSGFRTETMFETTTTIDLMHPAEVSNLRVRKKKTAIKQQLRVAKSNDFSAFYSVLQQRLSDKYDKQPVHSLEELELLSHRFPENISLYTVLNEQSDVIGGCVIYRANKVWHSQYVSASEEGMAKGALDLLFFELIEQAKSFGARYFDFGISTEDSGRYLNESLISFKEGFGGRSLLHHKLNVSLECKSC